MNTMITLFGGLAAVLILYGISGLFRGMPPLLRAVLAAVIPLIAYFFIIMGNWPGLDMVAMHVSVFFVTALVLLAVTQLRRRGAGRLHWGPQVLIGFFVSLVFINATLMYISTQGLPEPIGRWWLGSKGGAVYSGFSGVVPHGENAAKAVSSELSETHRELKLGWQVEVSGLNGKGNTRQVEVRVKDRTGLPVDQIVAELRLQRPGAPAPTLTLRLNETDAGLYAGAMNLPGAGRWLVDIQLKQDGEVHHHTTQELIAS
jgi:nitrogen fixation protein FixH